MAKIKKSVTRLLAERKALESRIRQASGAGFIAAQRGDASPIPVGYVGKTVEQVSTLLKGNLDKAKALIAYHGRITVALIKSNAETNVVIGGKTMSVAAAIERKTSIAFEKTLLASVLQQAQQVQHAIENANVTVEATIERQLASVYGGDKTKAVTADQRKEAAKAVNDVQRQSVIDPNKLSDYATDQLEALSLFETEVDFVLSEINAKTEIEIEDENETPEPAGTVLKTETFQLGNTTVTTETYK